MTMLKWNLKYFSTIIRQLHVEMETTPDFVNEAPYRAFFQTTISPILVICPKKVMARQ